MSAAGIRAIYRFAAKNPSLPVTIIKGPDRLAGGEVATPDPVSPARNGCPEARTGARRLARLSLHEGRHDRVCGGVDHWYAVELSGGDRLEFALEHGGGLRLELYGIRGISTVARGEAGFSYRVPLARNNRGNRYVRVVAPTDATRTVQYKLVVKAGRRASPTGRKTKAVSSSPP